MMKKRMLSTIGAICLFAVFAESKQTKCPVVKMEPERLADMNIPRLGHTICNLNGEITIMGGHTTGFVLTPTAEYYRDGRWHLVPMAYAHDAAYSLPLRSGKVLVAGGFEKNLGIGQSYEVEFYDRQSHDMVGYGCLDQKRASLSCMELDSGRVVVTGNWYHDDCIEMYDGRGRFSYVKPVAQHRAFPYIFRTAPDDVVVFGGRDNYSNPFDTIVIDRLKGEPFTDQFFDEWKPIPVHFSFNCDGCAIGDSSKGEYAYLFLVEDKDGNAALAKAEGMRFSLMPTVSAVPTTCDGQRICWLSAMMVDRRHQRAFALGQTYKPKDSDVRNYVLCVDYGKVATKGAAVLTLYYFNCVDGASANHPVLTDDGDLMLTGRAFLKDDLGNFNPSASVFLLRFGTSTVGASIDSSWWIWLVVIFLLIGVVTVICWLLRHRRISSLSAEETEPLLNGDEQMMKRISQLMEEQKLFLNPDLRVSDIAKMLGTNSRYVSNCINLQKGCSFSSFVSVYRVEYAQQLMRQQPDAKNTEVYLRSGFTNETSFFRTFKMQTGMTPKEWKSYISSGSDRTN